MIVVNNNETTHNIDFVPRFYASGVVDMTLIKEGDNTEIVINDVFYANIGGKMAVTFLFSFNKGDKYSVKFTNNEVIYKGRIFATNNNTQEYQENTFIYV